MDEVSKERRMRWIDEIFGSWRSYREGSKLLGRQKVDVGGTMKWECILEVDRE